MSRSGARLPLHELDGLSPHEYARRQAIDAEARERASSWQTVILDALTASGVLPADLTARQEELDRIALDALRHIMRDWQAPTGGTSLVVRCVEQASARLLPEVERMVCEQVAQAVEDALSEGGEEEQ